MGNHQPARRPLLDTRRTDGVVIFHGLPRSMSGASLAIQAARVSPALAGTPCISLTTAVPRKSFSQSIVHTISACRSRASPPPRSPAAWRPSSPAQSAPRNPHGYARPRQSPLPSVSFAAPRPSPGAAPRAWRARPYARGETSRPDRRAPGAEPLPSRAPPGARGDDPRPVARAGRRGRRAGTGAGCPAPAPLGWSPPPCSCFVVNDLAVLGSCVRLGIAGIRVHRWQLLGYPRRLFALFNHRLDRLLPFLPIRRARQ